MLNVLSNAWSGGRADGEEAVAVGLVLPAASQRLRRTLRRAWALLQAAPSTFRLVSSKYMISTAPARKNADVSASADPMPTFGSVAT